MLALMDKYIGEVNSAAAVLKLNNPSELKNKC